MRNDAELNPKVMSDYLMVSFDAAPKDAPMLIVARHENDKTYVVKTFYNEEAWAVYNKLLGNF